MNFSYSIQMQQNESKKGKSCLLPFFLPLPFLLFSFFFFLFLSFLPLLR